MAIHHLKLYPRLLDLDQHLLVRRFRWKIPDMILQDHTKVNPYTLYCNSLPVIMQLSY